MTAPLARRSAGPALWAWLLLSILVGGATPWAALAAAPKPAASPAAKLLTEVREATLPNGLRVLVLERPACPIVAVDVFYRVGAVDEPLGKTGMAHFLEHMMFKGTAKLAKGEIDALTLTYAGENNAETWEDFTHYWFSFPSDRWEVALKIEADRMTNLVIDPKELAAELNVVLEEANAWDDNPFGKLMDQAAATTFAVHPYRNPILGWRAELTKLTAEDLMAFYRQYYRPDNAVIVIVGDVKADAAIAKVREAFAGVRAPATPLPAPPKAATTPEPPQKEPRRFTLKPDARPAARSQTSYGVFQWRTDPAYAEDEAAVDLLAWILADEGLMRLGDRLDEQLDNWSGDVSVTHDTRRYDGLLQLSLTLRSDEQPEAIESAVLKLLRRIARRGVDEQDLQRAQTMARNQFRFEQEDPLSLARMLGRAAVLGKWQAAAKLEEAYAAVTMDDIRRVAGRLTESRLTVGWRLAPPPDPNAPKLLVNDDPPAAVKLPGRAEHRNHEPVELKVAPPETSPKLTGWGPTRWVMDNGLTVIVQPRAVPVGALRVWVDAGPLREAQPGVAHVVGELLHAGSEKIDAAALLTAFQDLGISPTTSSEGLAVKFRPEDLDRVLELAAEMLTRPALSEDEFDLVVEELAEALKNEDDAESLAYQKLLRAIYGDHPAGRDSRGTADSLAKLTVADVTAHHRKYYVPGNAVVVLAGDFTVDAVRAAVARHFSHWKGAKPDFPPVAPFQRAEKGTRVTVELPDRQQVQILVGHLGVTRRDPDWYALAVMDYIVGSGPGFTSRLSRTLRDERGLAYTVNADISKSADVQPGVFSAYAAVKPENRDAAVDGILTEIQRAAAGDFGEEEFRRARAYLLASWVFEYQTCELVADRLIEIERFGLGLDHPHRLAERLRAVRLADVKRAAAKHLSVAACHVVEVGPRKSR